METNAVWLKLEEKDMVGVLQHASAQLNGTEGEVLLDFTSVHRLDASALRAIEELTRTAQGKAVKIVLRGVNVNIYKVLKLAKLAAFFSFPA